MTDRTEDRYKNPALRLGLAIAEARLERAGVKMGDDWGLRPVNPEDRAAYPKELIRKIAGG